MNLIPRKFYLDDFFEDFVGTSSDMKCDIYEKDGNYNIDIDLPGYEKEEIKLEYKNGYLNVTAEKNSTNVDNDEGKTYYRRERVVSKVQRSFSLGDVNEGDIKATFKNGILNISVPKKEEIDTKKFIEIE